MFGGGYGRERGEAEERIGRDGKEGPKETREWTSSWCQMDESGSIYQGKGGNYQEGVLHAAGLEERKKSEKKRLLSRRRKKKQNMNSRIWMLTKVL